MTKVGVGILDDDKWLLKQLKLDLEATGLVEVKVASCQSWDFLDKVGGADVQMVILDIDLKGDRMSGLEVASLVKLPVLFYTGKILDNVFRINELNWSTRLPVDSLVKPASVEKLKFSLSKFIPRVSEYENSNSVRLDFKGSKSNLIKKSDIVFVETETGSGGESGNKRIHFINRCPEILIDKTYNDLKKIGLDKPVFLVPHRSYLVNGVRIKGYHDDHRLIVESMNENGKMEIKNIPVSETYRPVFKGEIDRLHGSK